MRLPPLPMRPHFVDKLWGGRRIAALRAKQRPGHRPPAGPVGESWEVSDLPEGESVVDSGPYADAPLSELVHRFGHDLVGTAHPAHRFPILVKLIDAREDLSVQVHPDAAWAAAHPGTHSKDEAWLVLAAAAGAQILHGVVPGTTRERLSAAARAGDPEAILRHVPVAPGDVIHVAPGTIHAIGRGVMILEVQEPSDTTFRLSDFGRLDHNGRPRPLHIQEALEVARIDSVPAILRARDGEPLVQTRSFSMRRLRTGESTPVVVEGDGARALVLHALDGDVILLGAESTFEVPVPCGGSVVIPASAGRVLVQGSSSSATHVIVMA